MPVQVAASCARLVQKAGGQMRIVMGIFAHPDDESLLAGGTLARHVAEGDDVYVAVLSDGVGSRFRPDQAFEQAAAANRRARHFEAACDALGIINRQMLSVFPDQRSDSVSQLTINKAVEAFIHQHAPWRVYTHFAGDVNLDHRRVSEAVQVATRGRCEVWCAEPEWPARYVGRAFDSDMRMLDIPIQTKLKACAQYVDELHREPHPRSMEALRRKAQCGEAFEVIR